MADTEPTMSGSQPAKDEQPLQQPQDAVPMEQMAKKEDASIPVATAEGDKSITAAAATSDPQSAAIGATEPAPADQPSPAKGKEKEQPLGSAEPTEKQDEEDSLSIEPSDGLAQIGGASSSQPDLLVCNITLLLPTGARHPYRIDEKYLAKRSVEVPEVTEAGHKDPFSISIYKLKELILREWRDEWELKPASPSSIRLIHFGKLLEDKEQLNKYQFSADSPNVVHMSVKPAEMMEEDEAGKTSGRDGRSREGGSNCCVIL